MRDYLDFKTNYFFPPMTRYLGYVIFVIGIIGIFTRGLETLIISFVGLGLSFTRYGVLVDLKNRKIKEYNSVYWITFGQWKSLDTYPYITVLEITEKHSMYSRTQVEHSDRSLVYRITLLNENHYQKILIKQLNDRDQAHAEALEIANKLNVEKVIYSPH